MAPKVAEKAVKAPATKAPAAKKVVKKATAGASKKKVKAVESYKIYIYKVLKQVGLRGSATLMICVAKHCRAGINLNGAHLRSLSRSMKTC